MSKPLNTTTYALDSNNVSEADLLNDLESMGVDLEQTQKEIKQDKLKADEAMVRRVEQAEAQFATSQTGFNLLTGVSTGFRDIGRNIYNAAVDVLDSADDYAATKGIGRGEMFNQSQKWSDPEGAAAKAEMGTSGRVANAVTQFAAPLAVGMASGGVAAGLATDAVYSFLAIDPSEDRLSDHLKGTAVEDVPILADVVGYLQTKPEDSDLDSRVKNTLEGLGIGAPIAGMLWGASKAYTWIKNWRNPKVIEGVERAARTAERAANMPPPAAPAAVTTAAEQATAPVTAAEQAALDASDAAISQASKESGAIPIKDNGLTEAEKAVPVVDTATPIHQDDIDILANELYSEFNPKEQLKLKSPRLLDDLLDSNSGQVKAPDVTYLPQQSPYQPHTVPTEVQARFETYLAEGSVRRSAQAGANDPSYRPYTISQEINGTHLDKVKDLPTKNINVAGTEYQIKPVVENNKIVIRASKDGSTDNQAYMILHLEFKGTDRVATLTPGMIKKNKSDAGVPIELFKYVREFIGEMQPSEILTPAGKAFTTRNIQRNNAERLRPYQELAERILKEDNTLAKATNIDTPEQLDLFEKQWADLDPAVPAARVVDDGTIRVNLADDNLIDKLYEVTKAIPGNVLREPLTDAQLRNAARIMQDDPDVVARILNYSQEAGVPTDKETLVAHAMLDRAQYELVDVFQSVDKADDASLIKASRALEGFIRMGDIIEGAASAKGASLRAEQLLARAAAMGEKEAMAVIGARGRAMLFRRLLDKAGGAEGLRSSVDHINLFNEARSILQLPDNAFRKVGNDIRLATKTWGVQQGITKGIINFMLSSPKTWARAFVGNAISTTNEVLKNYISASISSSVTYKEANQHVIGLMSGMLDGLGAAYQSVKNPTSKTMRSDFLEGVAPLSMSFEEKAMKGVGAFASTRGVGTVLDTAVSTPTRILMGVDAFWSTANTKAYKYREAARFMDANPTAHFDEAIEAVTSNVHVLERAEEFAKTITLQKELTGIAEKADDVLQGAADRYSPLVRVVVPFFKTTVNAAEYTMKNSPLAIAAPGVRRAIAAGGRQRAEALAGMISGSTMMGAVAYMTSQGMVKGSDSGNDNLKGIEYGIRGSSVPRGPAIKVGDEWVSVAGIEPIASIIEMGTVLSKASGYLSDDEYSELIQTGTATMMDHMTTAAVRTAGALKFTGDLASEALAPEMFVDNLSTLIKTIGGDADAREKLLTNYTTMLVPNILGDVRKEVDPFMRSNMTAREGVRGWIEGVKNRYQNKIPWLSTNLPAQRNIFGQKVRVPEGLGPDFISPLALSSGKGLPMKNALESINNYASEFEGTDNVKPSLNVSAPFQYLDVPGTNGIRIKLDPHEYELLQIASAGINPATGEAFDTARGDLYDRWDRTLKAYDYYGKDPRQMDNRQYLLMVAELRQSYHECIELGKTFIKQEPTIQDRLRKVLLESDRKQGAY